MPAEAQSQSTYQLMPHHKYSTSQLQVWKHSSSWTDIAHLAALGTREHGSIEDSIHATLLSTRTRPNTGLSLMPLPLQTTTTWCTRIWTLVCTTLPSPTWPTPISRQEPCLHRPSLQCQPLGNGKGQHPRKCHWPRHHHAVFRPNGTHLS